jgi:hypothetical protein
VELLLALLLIQLPRLRHPHAPFKLVLKAPAIAGWALIEGGRAWVGGTSGCGCQPVCQVPLQH